MRCGKEDGRCRRSPGTWEGTARRSGRTCRAKREPGQRKPAGRTGSGGSSRTAEIRFGDDPHLWATTLFDEVAELGYDGAYPSFTRALRRRGLRPRCEDCAAAGVPEEFAVIDHPAGEETQWDWVELPDPPPSWGWGKNAHLLVGALSHSGAWRGVLAESEEQPYLVASLHGVCERLGGVTRRWRFDRMSTVCYPGVRGPDSRRSRRPRSTTAWPWTCARRGAAGARAWWRRRTTRRRSGGGGPCLMR